MELDPPVVVLVWPLHVQSHFHERPLHLGDFGAFPVSPKITGRALSGLSETFAPQRGEQLFILTF